MEIEIIMYVLKTLLLLFVGVWCFLQFLKNKTLILQHQDLIPGQEIFFVEEIVFPSSEIGRLKTEWKTILSMEKSQRSSILVNEGHPGSKAAIKLINITNYHDPNNQTFLEILQNINTYLIKNISFETDLQVLQAIIERKIESSTSKVELSINLPLYLGLLGTFSGIILGLISLSGEGIDNLFSISNLLFNVALSMIVSGAGLFFTVLNFQQYKTAVHVSAQRKNDLINFLQLEFHSSQKKDISSAIFSLQGSMQQFNKEFRDSLTSFSFSMNKVEQIVATQENILNVINQSNITEIIRFNREMVEQIAQSADSIKSFNTFSIQLSDSSQILLTAVQEIVALSNRSKTIETHLNQLTNHVFLQQDVFKDVALFFSQNTKEIEARQGLLNQTMDELTKSIKTHLDSLNNQVWKELDALKQTVASKNEEVRTIADHDIDILQKLYSSRIDAFAHFARLETIETQNAQLVEILKELSSVHGQVGIESNVIELNRSIKLIAENVQKGLNSSQPISPQSKPNWFFSWFNRLFSKPKS